MGGSVAKNVQVSKHDKALLNVKYMRDAIRMYQRKLDNNLLYERDLARQLINQGRRERAKSLLKRKYVLEKQLRNSDSYLEELEDMIYELELTQLKRRFEHGMKIGNEALKTVDHLLALKNVHEVLHETPKGEHKLKEIDGMMKTLTKDDEEMEGALESELTSLSLASKSKGNLLKKDLKLKAKGINSEKVSTISVSPSSVVSKGSHVDHPLRHDETKKELRRRTSSIMKGLKMSGINL